MRSNPVRYPRFAQEFTDNLNSLDPDIKFTFEQEEDGSLPFLDTLTTINQDRSLRVSIYRKATHTDQYLKFFSNHPLDHKLVVIKTLLHRANAIISDPADRSSEIDHVTEALKKCGYPQWLIRKASEPRQPLTKPQDSQGTGGKNRKTLVILPYVKGVSEPLRRIFAAHGVSQHIHIESPGHTVDLEGVRILDTEQDYFKRGIKEAIYIRALQPSLNRDVGRYRLQTTFDPLLTSHVGKITCPQHLGRIAEED
ncbi:hypothetical protein Bbelb_376810 [Branchiostoma belcheri]|nr:hypothetical protein Bbelb_376810 [Branchiostoma belcheri]